MQIVKLYARSFSKDLPKLRDWDKQERQCKGLLKVCLINWKWKWSLSFCTHEWSIFGSWVDEPWLQSDSFSAYICFCIWILLLLLLSEWLGHKFHCKRTVYFKSIYFGCTYFEIGKFLSEHILLLQIKLCNCCCVTVGVGKIFSQRANTGFFLVIAKTIFPGGLAMMKFHFNNLKLSEKCFYMKTSNSKI